MALTPVELRHVSLPRRRLVGGYPRAPVDELLTDVADAFEDVWRERADLTDHVEQLETDLARHREVENLLRMTLVTAERSAHELKDQAKREAELVVEEAHAEARRIVREATAERERLLAESRRARSLLRSALDSLDDAVPVSLQNGEAEAA